MNKLLYLSLIVFVLLLLSVNQGVVVIQLDENIRLGLQNIWNKNLNEWIIKITDFGAETSVFLSLVVVVLFFAWKKETRYIRFYFTGLFGAILLFELIKIIIGRPRPDSMMIAEVAKSFPSGHATISTVLAWFAFYAFVPRTSGNFKSLLILICIVYPLLMSFTRVYLNVHYLSDVVAGIALGTCWMIFLSKFYINNEAQIPIA